MCVSDNLNLKPFTEALQWFDCKTAIEMGIGWGQVGMWIKTHYPAISIDGVEIWKDYKTDNWSFYNKIYLRNITRVLDELPMYDAVLLPDVLEHFERKEAMKVWNKCHKIAKKILLVSLPIYGYEQGATQGNPYQRHRTQFNEQDWLNEGCVTLAKNNVVGVFVKNLTKQMETAEVIQ